MVQSALIVLAFTLLGVLAGWKVRGTCDEFRTTYDTYDHVGREAD